MKIFKRIGLLFEYYKKKDAKLREFAIGMSSEVSIDKDLHILFMDYDEVSLEEVEESVFECQEFWGLSDCYIYETQNGFHSYYYYDIMPYSRVRMIINYAKYVDNMFKFISRFYDYKTIRIAGKYKKPDLKFRKVIKGDRAPSLMEVEIGDLKRREREHIAQMSRILRKDKLRGGDDETS